MEAKIQEMQAEHNLAEIAKMLDSASPQEGYKLIVTELAEGSDLKSFSEILKDKLRDHIAVIFCKKGDKLSILTAVGKELLPKYHAGKLVSSIAAQIGAKGGGRPDCAMAGGPLPATLDNLKEQIPLIIKSEK